jgi:NAD(P)-dependent dehydrogenase (short-subunit alcohol dehydrogenase family)
MTTRTKIALVTGGSRGLGREMVIDLAKKGNNILFTYRNNILEAERVVEEVERIGVSVKAFQLDAGNISSFDRFIEEVSNYLTDWEGSANFDFLVHNAGLGIYGSVTETTEQIFDELMNVHFKGVYFLTQKLLPLLNDGGRIINVSSGLTRVSFPNVSAYASMKGAIETYTRCLAKELGSRQITANVVAPGAIATDFGGGSNRSDENKRNAIASITALGRVGNPDDIGGIVAFLCTPEARWINGQRIEASGGLMV